ncbi:hypothetical protein [Streptomyces sp. NPDC001404]|uniref:hypothetical protein n=1 Tax=Streptomyces sp. NPDC001404 TaxID=3364571 RepID=UPI0036BE1E4E
MTTKPPPKHGQRACYLRGCRRLECHAAHKRYCKQRDFRAHREGPRHIDATPAAEHVKSLAAAGWTQTGIAEATGCGIHTICSLINGNQKKVRPETAQRLLAFKPGLDAEPLGYWTNPIGTIRRLQALAVMGHPIYRIAETIGVSHSHLRSISAGHREKVSKTTARKIAQLYGQLIQQPGTSATTRGIARARGWHGPAAWDDLDDLNCKPASDEQLEHRNKLQVAQDRRTEIQHLASFGVPEHEIADRLAMTPAYVRGLLRNMRQQQTVAA